MSSSGFLGEKFFEVNKKSEKGFVVELDECMKQIITNLLTNDFLDIAARRFGVTLKELVLLSDEENYIYEYSLDGEKFILRLTHNTLRTDENVIAEIDWLLYLRHSGMRIYQPILSIAKNFIEKVYSEGTYFTVVSFVKVPGNWPIKKITDQNFITHIGSTIGKFHSLTKKYIVSEY